MQLETPHTISIVEARPAPAHAHPEVGARCTCGWQGARKVGQRGTDFAIAEGQAHIARMQGGIAYGPCA
jgi:hypothetical protein